MARTDAQIEANPHFHKWDYRGNKLQRRLRIGPKAPLFDPIAEKHVIQALEMQDPDELQALKMAFAAGSSIYTGENKTVRPTRWWIDFAEGQVQRNYERLYRSSAWVYRCVDIRSQALAQTPWQVVNAAGEAVENSPLLELLETVNPESNWGDHIAGTEADLSIFGMAFWLKVKGYIQRLNPTGIEILRDNSGFIKGFKYGRGQQRREYKRDEVVYFHTYNPEDDVEGLSPLEICRKAIEIDAAANEHMADFFENRAMPAYIFSMETQDANELARASALWQKMYGGKGKQFQTAFIGGGGKPETIGYAPEQLALKDVREEARKSICSALGVPPILVGAWEAANFATADEQRSSLYTETLIPRGEYIASVINAELAKGLGEDTFEWEWDQLDVMSEDEGRKAERLALLVREQILKPEIAAEEMGYDATDVLEPKPIPAPLAPGQQPGSPVPAELAKWRKKALKRLRDGKSPAAVFKSDVLDHKLTDYLLGALEECKTIKDVDRAFAKAQTWKDYP